MNFRNMGSDGKDGRPVESGNLLPLTRQSSVYSLTFEEFQNTLGGVGKDFGSMNMDELLKNIWTAEETQVMASALGPLEGGPASVGTGLQRQGSLTLPRTLSQKTVEDVWKDLIKEGGGQGPESSNFQPQRQPTLGEMTLEEFLVRAGVVREEIAQSIPRQIINNSSNNSNNNTSNSVYYGELPNNNTGLALGFPPTVRSNDGVVMPNSIPNGSVANLTMTTNGARSSYNNPMPLGNGTDLMNQQGMRGGGGIVGIGDPTMNNGLMQGMVGLGAGGVTVAAVGSPANQFASDVIGKSNGDLSSLSPVPYVFNARPRGANRSGAVEKVVERRQRRMIKNRESAARSRARKQAYTMELEAEVAKLKEHNEELQKKQEEIMEMQKNQVLELLNQQFGSKKRCLRRTQTGPW